MNAPGQRNRAAMTLATFWIAWISLLRRSMAENNKRLGAVSGKLA